VDSLAAATELLGSELSETVMKTARHLGPTPTAAVDSETSYLPASVSSSLSNVTLEQWAHGSLVLHHALMEAEAGLLNDDDNNSNSSKLTEPAFKKGSRLMLPNRWALASFAAVIWPAIIGSWVQGPRGIFRWALLVAGNAVTLFCMASGVHPKEKSTSSSPPFDSNAESLRWLSESFDSIWMAAAADASIGGVGALANALVVDKLSTALQESSVKPGSLAKVSVTRLNLGETPPRVSSVRVLRPAQASREVGFLAYEVGLDWTPREFELVIDVASTMLKRSALPKLAVRVADVSVSATVTLLVELTSSQPFVGRLAMSFPSSPSVDVSLSPYISARGIHSLAGRTRLDFAHLPLIQNFISSFIASSLSPYVAPGFAAIDLGQLVSHSPLPPQA